ncbi:7-carboxy-7-deazaguanine synthase QueE [Campylobacter majalis]|uniref:7-carboxy-7-deazaguanine synthase QueE n=1 Tax=Campylobacter majalis TaxID=2790656 RepID=UPI003D69172D
MSLLKVVESFLSIQGEGEFAGRVAYFIRLFGCNLNCAGFNTKKISPKTGEILVGCDTIRAVATSHFDAESFNSADEILNQFSKKCKNLIQKPLIVITGGEPLIHHQNEILIKLVSKLLDANYEVQFETNATIEIDFDKYSVYKECHFAMGIKLANSGVKQDKRINQNAIIAISKNAKSCFYKFVLSGDEQEIDEILNILKIYQNKIWCMPMGESKTKLEKIAPKVAQIAIKYGLNYTDRLHIRLWDKKEGV